MLAMNIMMGAGHPVLAVNIMMGAGGEHNDGCRPPCAAEGRNDGNASRYDTIRRGRYVIRPVSLLDYTRRVFSIGLFNAVLVVLYFWGE